MIQQEVLGVQEIEYTQQSLNSKDKKCVKTGEIQDSFKRLGQASYFVRCAQYFNLLPVQIKISGFRFRFRLVISREQRAHIMSWLSLLEYPWYNRALRFALQLPFVLLPSLALFGPEGGESLRTDGTWELA